jgi:hypothetical protein
MKIPDDYTNEELDAILDKMTPKGVMFLRAITARIIKALANQDPILTIFPDRQTNEAELYAMGLDNKEMYDTLVTSADILLDTQATAPSTDTEQ